MQTNNHPTTPKTRTRGAAPSPGERPDVDKSQAESTLTEIFGDPISSYSRAQAIEDGFLVDVSEPAREAGFSISVALTRAAWSDSVQWSEGDSKRQTYQDEAGRLWDVLWMAAAAARRGLGDRVPFRFYRVPRGGSGTKPRLMTLQMIIGPGDQGEPVVTILMLDED